MCGRLRQLGATPEDREELAGFSDGARESASV
jgi:hypothetical protein